MAYEVPGFNNTYIAGADLTLKQFQVMKVSGANVIPSAAATDVPVGILQDTPISGQSCNVMLTGISKVIAGGTITKGDLIGSNGDGRVKTIVAGTDTTVYVIGRALEDAVANDIFPAAINTLAPARAA